MDFWSDLGSKSELNRSMLVSRAALLRLGSPLTVGRRRSASRLVYAEYGSPEEVVTKEHFETPTKGSELNYNFD